MKKDAPVTIAAFAASDPDAANLRVVDAKSGDQINNVIEADSVAGKVRRYAVDDGVLVRDSNAFKVVEENRTIRIERITPRAAAAAIPDATNGADT